MKRIIALILCVLFLAACGKRTPDPKYMDQPVYFYYCAQGDGYYGGSDGALAAELQDLGENPLSWQQILERYLQGPQTEGLVSAFPAKVRLLEASEVDGILLVKLSPGMAEIPAVAQTMAAACLVRTMTQFDAINAVKLICEDVKEQGVLGRNLTGEEFLFLDDTATSDQTTVRLYFPDETGRYLEEEIRERVFDSDAQIPTYVVRQLLEGPADESHQPVLPEGTRLNTLWIRDGMCTVDLSMEFLRNPPQSHLQARMTVFSLVNSLTELPQIECVVLQSGGQRIYDYGGMDLSGPIYREELAIAQDMGDRTCDATLYLSYGQREALVPVPMVINRTSARSLEEDILHALLAYEDANKYESPISDGVVVMEEYISNGVCYITFNNAFALSDVDQELAQKAVRSVVCTLCALDEIDQVQIQIYNAEMTHVDLSQPLSPEASWVLQ